MSSSKKNNQGHDDLGKRLDLLMINMEEPFLLIDKKMIVVTFNENFKKQYEKYFGIEFVKGFSIFDYVQPERTESLKKIYAEVFKGKHIELEIESAISDNSKRTFLNKYKPALNEDGETVGAFISSLDITDKKNAELLHRSNEKRFQALIENANEIISLTNEHGDVLFISKAIEKMTGFTPEEIINKKCFLRMHPQQAEESKKILAQLLNNPGVTIPRVNRFLHKDGSYVWMEGSVINLLNDPDVNAIVSNYRDVTKRKLAEEKLKESENNLSAIFNNSSEAFTLLDKNCIIKALNSKAKENTGLTSKEIAVGDNLLDFIQDDRKNYFKEYINKVLNGETVDYETRYLNQDNGTLKWFHATLNPVKESEIITGICITRRDITHKKSAEEELKKSHELLKKLNESLERRAEELAATNSELEQFAYIASHDLQEPLRMVTSFLNLLELKYKPQLDDKAKQYIHFATDGAVRMRKIILDLLEYSMAGKKEHETEDVDINDLANEAVQLNRKAIEEKTALIEWDKLPVIKANRSSLQQVFQNLIANALKYQKTNVQPLIKISANETKTHWQFSFNDNGIGIDPIFFEKIFVVFQRLHNKDEYSGTGLGLAICKKIVENHNGKIWVASELEKGSTFYFTIAK